MSRETAADIAEGSAIGTIASLMITLIMGIGTATILGWYFLGIAFWIGLYATLSHGGE